MKLNFLTNPDQNLQQKMRFFSDYFLFANEYLGRLPDLPFDNPHSLISKIIFQVENNIERSPRYIENHFHQLTVFFGDFMMKQMPDFSNIKTAYDEYLKLPAKEKRRVKWLKENPEFLVLLQTVNTNLDSTLLSKIFVWLSRYMVCKHKLQRHKKDIEFCTQILISLFRFNGHSKKQVDGYIGRILSANRYQFPFPLDVYDHNKDDSFNTITDEFLAKRDFQKQFDGLKNLMINPKYRKGYFIYAINHVNIDKKISTSLKFQIDKVTFISPSHPQFRNLKRSIKQDDLENHVKTFSRFFGKQKLLAYVNLHYEDKDYTRDEGEKIVAIEIGYLNEYLNAELKIQEGDFLFTENFKDNDWRSKVAMTKYKLLHLDKMRYDWAKENPFEKLRQTTSPGENQLLHNEKIFIKAMTEDDISLYWQYIENLFWFQNENNDKVRSKFARLVAKDITSFQDVLLLSLGYLLFGLHYSKFSNEIGPDQKTLELLSAELGYKRNTKFSIRKYKSVFKHPLLKSIIDRYLKTKSKKYYPEWESYLAALILELYEFRNTELHSGRVNSFAKIKMKELMPAIMYRARRVIIEACKENNTLRFNEIITKLTIS